MEEKEGVTEFKLDTLTRSTRFIASIGPRCATRISLGVCLGLEDSLTDSAGELLGIKLHSGASALASGIGSIASSMREGVRSGAKRLSAEDGPLSKAPVLEEALGFVTQAVTEVKESWAAAGQIQVQLEEVDGAQFEAPAPASAGSDSQPDVHPVDGVEEVNS